MLGEPDQNSKNFPKILWILNGIPGKPFKILQNSGIPQDSESAGSGITYKLLLPFLEILKFLGTQFSVVHGGGGGVDIFWNSPLQRKWWIKESEVCVIRTAILCNAGNLQKHVSTNRSLFDVELSWPISVLIYWLTAIEKQGTAVCKKVTKFNIDFPSRDGNKTHHSASRLSDGNFVSKTIELDIEKAQGQSDRMTLSLFQKLVGFIASSWVRAFVRSDVFFRDKIHCCSFDWYHQSPDLNAIF